MREASVNVECWKGTRTAPPASGHRPYERRRPQPPPLQHRMPSGARTAPHALGYHPVRTTSPQPQLGLRISSKSARRPCVGDNAALITPSSGESDEVASSDWEVDVQLVRSLRQRRVLEGTSTAPPASGHHPYERRRPRRHSNLACHRVRERRRTRWVITRCERHRPSHS